MNARVQVVFQDAFQTLKIPEPEHAGVSMRQEIALKESNEIPTSRKLPV